MKTKYGLRHLETDRPRMWMFFAERKTHLERFSHCSDVFVESEAIQGWNRVVLKARH